MDNTGEITFIINRNICSTPIEIVVCDPSQLLEALIITADEATIEIVINPLADNLLIDIFIDPEIGVINIAVQLFLTLNL